MIDALKKYYLFLFLVILFSIPFYSIAVFFQVDFLPFNLPISSLMIFVPCILSLIYSYHELRRSGIKHFISCAFNCKGLDIKSTLFSFFYIPVIACLAFLIQYFCKYNVPQNIVIALNELPLMFILYFLSAIPEEIGWTYIVTGKFSKYYGPVYTGFIIGLFWAVWHILPWSLSHSAEWVIFMSLYTVLIRAVMVFIYVNNKNLLLAVIFHTMSNVSVTIFPNNGSHFSPQIFCIIIMPVLVLQFLFYQKYGKRHLPARNGV